jgi:universal stress protein A
VFILLNHGLETLAGGKLVDDIKRILVVSRMSRYCRKAVHYGVSLCQKYGAELYVIYVAYDPFIFGAWNLPMPSLEKEYKKTLNEAKRELDTIIDLEKKKGVLIKELIKEGKPTEEILKVVKEENIDLIIMLAHEEGHLEHFLFGRSNEEIIRKMPCSILMVKKEPEPVTF